ncbi:MAG: type II toxin-antitoxin system RelE/ParE family toxin [Bacteroidetes bacterium]|nr:type II toxin-antitoxin system RelE/ParE family toxin [Bacteroidota bacterium]
MPSIFCRTSAQYASVVVRKLFDAVGRLTEHPKLGRQVTEVEHGSRRELIVESYRVVYQVQDERLEIVPVLHSR